MEWVFIGGGLYLVWRLGRWLITPREPDAPYVDSAASLIARNNLAPPPQAPAEPLMPRAASLLRRAPRLPSWRAQRLDGAFFMIEYVRADGEFSRRRITTRRIAYNPDGRMLLVAYCHERDKIRNFRIDRIKCCIDQDGVVHDDAAAFLSETFGALTKTPPKLATNSATPTSAEVFDNWNKTRDTIRPQVVILTALALADGEIHPREREVIISHCIDLSRRSRCPVDANLDKLNRYITRMKPNHQGLLNAIEIMQGYSLRECGKLVDTAALLVKADGVLDSTEMAFLKDLKDQLGVR